jgi:hypothetical protein
MKQIEWHSLFPLDVVHPANARGVPEWLVHEGFDDDSVCMLIGGLKVCPV